MKIGPAKTELFSEDRHTNIMKLSHLSCVKVPKNKKKKPYTQKNNYENNMHQEKFPCVMVTVIRD